MHCKQSNNDGTYHLKENGVLVTDKKEVAAIFNNYFSLIQNVGEEHDDEFDKSKYRPVSILVLLDKVFERCVQKQLVHYFNPHLSKFLSAYRKGYSCESVLLHLIEDWKGALDKNSVVGTVIIDLSKAFDLIPQDLLLARLSAYGISTHSLNLLRGTQREYSSKPLKHSIVKRILVFKR